MPEIIGKITGTQMAEDVIAYSRAIPPFASASAFHGEHRADSEKELEFKQEIIWDDTWENTQAGTGGTWDLPAGRSSPISKSSDYKKGGGFEYVGSIMPSKNTRNAIARDGRYRRDMTSPTP